MLDTKPWEGYIKPTRIFGNLYFAGTRPASTHLIDTGDGLILIDAGYQDSLYLVIQNIWELGFNPKDIKYIILSHGHYDHMNATKALTMLTGAKTFLGKDDLAMVTNEADIRTKPFTPDVLLEDGDVITLGNTSIKCVSTPGHTDGTMSFFFDVTDGKNTYRAGMHGGVGTNTLTREYLTQNNLPFENRQKFLDSLSKVENERVEIFIGNHVENNDTEGKIKRMETSAENPFINPNEWKEFINKRRLRLQEVIQSDK